MDGHGVLIEDQIIRSMRLDGWGGEVECVADAERDRDRRANDRYIYVYFHVINMWYVIRNINY